MHLARHLGLSRYTEILEHSAHAQANILMGKRGVWLIDVR